MQFQKAEYKLLYVRNILPSAVINFGDLKFINNIDYSVHGALKNKTFLMTTLLIGDENDTRWTNVKVSYLVSSRTDMFLGSIIADTF
jgi:hypothetical protein